MKTQQTDILEMIQRFQKDNSPNNRYCSFDYCYNYFRINPRDKLTNDIEKSCLVIGFYLASWGMLRGSSFLLQKSAKYFEPVIEYISTLDKNVWLVDVDKYDSKNIQLICDIYSEIKGKIIDGKSSDLTLITKIILGVFGFIPAFDQFFTNTFREIYGKDCGFRRLNHKSLQLVKDFYDSNKTAIDSISADIFTTDFVTGLKTEINYPKAKIIDMYGFTKGLKN